MTNRKFYVDIEFIGKVQDLQSKIKNVTNEISKMGSSSGGISVQKHFDKLTLSVQNLLTKAQQPIASQAEFNRLTSELNRAESEYNNLIASVERMQSLSKSQKLELLPSKEQERIQKANKAIHDYEQETEKASAAQQNLRKAQEDAAKAANKQTVLQERLKEIREQAQLAVKEYEKLRIAAANLAAAEENKSKLVYKTGSRAGQRKEGVSDEQWAEANLALEQAREKANSLKGEYANIADAAAAAKERADQLGKTELRIDEQLKTATIEATQLRKEAEQLEQDLQLNSGAELEASFQRLKQKAQELGVSVEDIKDSGQIEELKKRLIQLESQGLERVDREIDKVASSLRGELRSGLNSARQGLDEAAQSFDRFNTQAREMEQLQSQLGYFFSLTNGVHLFRSALQSAINTVKELDEQMLQTAVVTDFSVSDMWKKLPQYTKAASSLGAKVVDLYDATTLYYQQGLKSNEAMSLGIETMKMARIAGIDSAEATKAMTAALRGFNMELNETSAVRVNDVYSQLAAVTAADTNQIATAMEKTASIAASANMEFETTAALLAQIIETTQEAPETAGTAMKTIIARFTEVKELFSQGQLTGKDSEGEEININQIDAALKTVGISLKDFLNGKKGIDQIFLELAEKWEDLDLATQRYIATMAAGSRQQSRFLAMMSNYDRTMELVNAANNSAGASQIQFEKTTEGLTASLTRLENAWDQFLMGLANESVIKDVVDLLAKLLETINWITSAGENAGGAETLALRLGFTLTAFKGIKLLVNKGLTSVVSSFTNAGSTAGTSFWSGLGKSIKTTKNIKKATRHIKSHLSIMGEDGINMSQFFDDRLIGLQAGTEEYNSTLRKIGKQYGLSNKQLKSLNQSYQENGSTSKWCQAQYQKEKGALSKLDGQRKSNRKSLIEENNARIKSIATMAGVVIAIYAIVKAAELLKKQIDEQNYTTKEQLEDVKKIEEDLITTTDDLATKMNGLSDSHNQFNDLINKMKKVKKGTAEWAGAMHDARSQMAKILEAYPELRQIEGAIATEEGVQVLTDKGWAEYAKLLESSYIQQMELLYITKMSVLELEKVQSAENLGLPTSTITEEEEKQISDATTTGTYAGGATLGVAGWIAGTAIGAKAGAGVGSAIAPGLGTIIGAILGIALGAAIGAIAGGIDTAGEGVSPELINDIGRKAYEYKGQGFSAQEALAAEEGDKKIETFLVDSGLTAGSEDFNTMRDYMIENAEQFDRHSQYLAQSNEQLRDFAYNLGLFEAQRLGYSEDDAETYAAMVEIAVGGQFEQIQLDILTELKQEANITQLSTEAIDLTKVSADLIDKFLKYDSQSKKYKKEGNKLVYSDTGNQVSEAEFYHVLAASMAQEKLVESVEEGFNLVSSEQRALAWAIANNNVSFGAALGKINSSDAMPLINEGTELLQGLHLMATTFGSSYGAQIDMDDLAWWTYQNLWSEDGSQSAFDYDVIKTKYTPSMVAHGAQVNPGTTVSSEIKGQEIVTEKYTLFDKKVLGPNDPKNYNNPTEWASSSDYMGLGMNVYYKADSESYTTEGVATNLQKIFPDLDWENNGEMLLNLYLGGYQDELQNIVLQMIEKENLRRKYTEKTYNELYFEEGYQLLEGDGLKGYGLTFLKDVNFDSLDSFIDQFQKIANTYQMIDDNWLANTLQKFHTSLGSLDQESVTKALNIFMQMDLKSLDSIIYAKQTLEGLGVPEETLNTMEEMIVDLREFGIALQRIDLEVVIKQIEDLNKIVNKINKMEIDTNLTFSEEEYTAMISSGGFLQEEFVSTMDGFVYLGGTMTELRETLVKTNQILLDNQVEALRKKMKYVEGIEESGLQGKTWGSVATWDMGVIKDVVKEGLTNAGFNITEDGKIKYNENEINLESSKDIALMSTLLEGTILEGIDYETLSEIVSNGALQNSTVEGVKEFFKEVGDAWVNRITYENQLETGVTKIKQETLSGLTAQEMLDMIGQTDSHGYTYTADDIDAVLKARSQQEGTTIAGYQKGSQILESEARQAYDQVLTSGGSEAKAEEAYNDYINNKDNVDKANRLGQALALDANMNINQYKSLISIFDKYSGAVTKAKRGTEEYAQGVSKLQTAFQNAYGIELSSQFMLQHAALLEQVLAGEEGAWERWADAMAEETARGMNASMKNAVAGASEMVIAVDSIVKTISPTIGVTTTFNGEGLKNAQLGLQELGGQIVATQGQLNSMAALYDILGATIEFETATGWLVNGTMVIGDEMPNGAASGPYTVVTGTTVTNTGNDLDSYAPSSASEEWENPYDEFYNSVKKINAELRKRESLEREYERLLKRNAGTMEEMTANRRAQIESLQNELGQRETLKSNREKQMDDIQREYSDVSKYAWYDKTLGQVQIDWEELEKLEGSTDSDYTERVEEYISALEEQQGLIEEEVDAIEDIKDRVYDIYEENKDDYLDLEERIKEALIDARQKEIDELSAINDSINQANSDLLSAMQEQINEYRQNRDNEKTEKEISDKQRRLAYLQQDTSGVYDLEILQLQKEIDESTEDYTDTLVDQKISELQQQNDKAAQQREDQIRIAQAQLDQWVDSGAIWTEVNRLLAQGFGPESELIKVLQNSDSFSGMSHIEKMDWLNDLETSVNTALSWLELGAMQSLYKKGEQIKFATKNGVEMTGVVNEDGNVEVRDAEGNLTHLFGQESFSMDPSGKVTTSQHAIEGWVAAAKSTWDETPESSPSEGGSLSLDGVDNTDKAVANAIWQLGTNSGWGNGSERTKKLKEALGANNKVQWIINNFLANDQKVPYEGDLSKFTYESLTKTEEPEEHGYLALDGQKFETLEEAQQAVRKWYNDALADLLDRIAHGEGGNSQGYKSWAMAELAKKYEYYRSSITAYKTGGLVDFTGLAWLDGTKSDPEYVLNAKQTKEFLANDGDVTNVKPEKTKPHTKTTEEPEALDVVKKKPKLQAFKTGGLADFTGPAWLDGTKAKPEYILNADQTKAFFTLVDVLGALQYKESKASQNNGDNTYDIDINVESIGSDYDVEQLANTVKRLINEDARYRNNNAINLMR